MGPSPTPPPSSTSLTQHRTDFDEPPEAELPVVDDGQVQLRDLVSRVVQACYAEMTEMAET
jgi:mediator of RNA polymerase II transcription subunit 14